MKNISDILLLGNPKLYEVSKPIEQSELSELTDWVTDMHSAMEDIRTKYNFGRAIAAPQLGIMKRIIYMNIDKPVVIINPEFTYLSEEMFDVWDDCMSFPNLLVKVRRHKNAMLQYRDENWQLKELNLTGDLSELLQHEYDHLDGILCTMRAIDEKSFKWRII